MLVKQWEELWLDCYPEKMKIKKPLTLPQKYFNEFQNYFHNADEKLVSYSYIPEYPNKTTSKKPNTLFNNHFHLELKKGIIDSEVRDLRGNRKQEQKVPQKAVIGIGAGKNYTLYDVGTDNTQFVQAGCKSEKRIKGFGGL